jgi:DNA-binding CsgD family transcriptional regulator
MGEGTTPHVPSLVGREAELAEIGGLVDQARGGRSGVVVVRGEPGIGKTRLLDAIVSEADDIQILRLLGIESEMRLGYAALHQLLTPLANGIDALPAPQARALKAAFGLSDEGASDQFLVGLAALTLLTSAAEERPLLIVVDDTQWLDQESADALGFVARRLYADPVCLLVAMRDGADERRMFEGIPTRLLEPLSAAQSVELLDAATQAHLASHVRERVLADAMGNPLALVEFGRELSPDHAAGTVLLPEPLAVDRRLEDHFFRQVATLPPPTQRLLLLVAAEPTGDKDLVWRAAPALDLDEESMRPAQVAGLLAPPPRLAFRHPLIRSAVYQGASDAERRRVHEALAGAADQARDAERWVWHRAAAAQAPDDGLASALESAAHRAASHGRGAESAALLLRAADLTPDDGERAARLLRAAGADLTVGNTTRARSNLDRAFPDLGDPVLVAQARQIEGVIEFIGAFPESATDPSARRSASVALMLEAARGLAAHDVHLARDAMLDTVPMALFFGEASSVSFDEVLEIARSLELPPGTTPTTADLLLDAVVSLLADSYQAAAPRLREALAAMLADPDFLEVPRYLTRACYVAFALGDDDALRTLATACTLVSRRTNTFQGLAEGLNYLGLRELRVGSLDLADDLLGEERELQAVRRRRSPSSRAAELILSAWRGRDEVRGAVADLEASDGSVSLVSRWAGHALLVLELGLGNYQAAAAVSRDDWYHDLALGGLRAADAVEARVRAGDVDGARTAAAHLEARAAASHSPFDLGLVARAWALRADDAAAEEHHAESIRQLETCGADLHVARSRLLHGEWLRRQKRRRDARAQLEAAHDTFLSLGANAFAERARIELLATGARARQRVDETRNDLTPQEGQIARLAAGGATNAEIAERLFISANTVDYHLRKVYRKLQIASRHEIASALSAD